MRREKNKGLQAILIKLVAKEGFQFKLFVEQKCIAKSESNPENIILLKIALKKYCGEVSSHV